MTRVRWGGSLLEEAQLCGSPLLLTSAPHAVPAQPIAGLETVALSDGVSDADRAVHVVETIPAADAGVSLADARVVVGGSDFLRHYGLVMIIVLALAIFLFSRWIRDPQALRRVHRLLLQVPDLAELRSFAVEILGKLFRHLHDAWHGFWRLT